MTRTTNARIAGSTFLAYIAAGITSMILFRRAAGGEGIGAKLAGIAAHATDVGVLALTATFFAVGSTAFAYLLLRGG